MIAITMSIEKSGTVPTGLVEDGGMFTVMFDREIDIGGFTTNEFNHIAKIPINSELPIHP